MAKSVAILSVVESNMKANLSLLLSLNPERRIELALEKFDVSVLTAISEFLTVLGKGCANALSLLRNEGDSSTDSSEDEKSTKKKKKATNGRRSQLKELPLKYREFKGLSNAGMLEKEDYVMPEAVYDSKSYNNPKQRTQDGVTWTMYVEKMEKKVANWGIVSTITDFKENLKDFTKGSDHMKSDEKSELWTKYKLSAKLLKGLKTLGPKSGGAKKRGEPTKKKKAVKIVALKKKDTGGLSEEAFAELTTMAVDEEFVDL